MEERMSPYERALQLKESFNHALTTRDCAMVCVDELIEVAPWAGDIDGEIEEGSKEYYIQVKEELRKL